jgi:hypothetical protein
MAYLEAVLAFIFATNVLHTFLDWRQLKVQPGAPAPSSLIV